ncbi:MAG TPA: glutamate racemase [Desulfobulbus sp.]|nr:glutamate racemase [Desulfobulbus sp.]
MIGIFDSGVGGMTVARAIEQLCPDYPLIYFGDIARTPYGSKSPETIQRYAVNNTNFLLDQGAELIVIACNSAASTALPALHDQFDLPILDVITPAVQQAVKVTKNGKIGIIGTRATIKSTIYEQGITTRRPGSKVFSQPCPLLVPLVEEGWLGKRETKMILRRYLYPLRRHQIDTLVLGCTHYPLLKQLIAPRIGRRVQLIDSSVAVARTLQSFLAGHADLAEKLYQPQTKSRFFVSDLTETAGQLAAHIFGRFITLEKVNV